MKKKSHINTTIRDIRLIDIPFFHDYNGDLSVLESGVSVPIPILRVFVVRAIDGSIRGEHAHKACTQVLTCPSGIIEVLCDDGNNKSIYIINHPNQALLIPPGIWAEQTYRGETTVLTVLCDMLYDANDYIRDYKEFINLKNNF